MSRCKKHISDHSSSIGVCASCLRERLFSLLAAQAQALAQAQAYEGGRKSDPNLPPPLSFPRSVSPYISRRKSDNSSTSSPWDDRDHPHHHHHRHRHRRGHRHGLTDLRFFSTPQVGPTTQTTTSTATATATTSSSLDPNSSGDHGNNNNNKKKKKKKKMRALLSAVFFGTAIRSHKTPDSEQQQQQPPRISSDSMPSPSAYSTPNWFSSVLLPGRRRKPSALESPARRMPCRGMSPDCDGDDCCDGSSPWASGYSTEAWRTPVVAAAARRGRPSGHARNLSGLAFCLSPLVRASPGRHWRMPPECGGLSGEIRVSSGGGSNKPYLSAAASFCSNRSRKLADMGRSNNNR